MKSWFFPTNIHNFRIHDYLSNHDIIDYKQTRNAHVQVGDIVYIYCTLPEGRVCYKMLVEKVNIPTEQSIDDSEYCLSLTQTNEYQKGSYFCRLKLIKYIDSNLLSLSNLRNRGLRSCLQSQQSVLPCLLPYVEKCFEENYI